MHASHRLDAAKASEPKSTHRQLFPVCAERTALTVSAEQIRFAFEGVGGAGSGGDWWGAGEASPIWAVGTILSLFASPED